MALEEIQMRDHLGIDSQLEEGRATDAERVLERPRSLYPLRAGAKGPHVRGGASVSQKA
jgi:hypothetical protein